MPTDKLLDLSPLQIRAFLLCASGVSQKEVAKRLDRTPATICELLQDLAETFLPKSDFVNQPGATNKKKRNPLFKSDSALSKKGEWVREILHEVDTAFRNLENQVSPNRLSLGFTKSCTGLMDAALPALAQALPNIQYELISDSSQVLAKAVVSARIDAAIVLDEVLKRESAEAKQKWGYDPLLSAGGFAQKSRLYVSALADSLGKDSSTDRQLNNDQTRKLFSDKTIKWAWYHHKYLPDLFGQITQYSTNLQGKGFAIAYPLHDQESLYGCIIANKGMAILPEAVALSRYPGIVGYDLPNNFPVWSYSVIRHRSNAHPHVLSTCDTLVQCGKGNSSATQ